MKQLIVIMFLVPLTVCAQHSLEWSKERKLEFFQNADWDNDMAYLSVNQDFDSLEVLYQMALDCENDYYKGNILSLMGSSKGRAAQFDKALDYYLRSIETYEKAGFYVEAAFTKCLIGVEFYSKKEYKLVRKYCLEALPVLKDSNSIDLMEPYLTIADSYVAEDSMEQAKRYLDLIKVELLPRLEENHYKKRYLELEGVYFAKMGDWDKAEKVFKETYEFDKLEDMVPGMINSMGLLVQVSIRQEDYNKAKRYLDTAYYIIEGREDNLDIFLRDMHLFSGMIYEGLGQYDSSIVYYKKYQEVKVMLEDKVNDEQMKEMLALYEVAILEEEELEAQKRIQELNMSTNQEKFVNAWLLIIGGVLTSLAGTILFLLYRALRRKKLMLKKNKEKALLEGELLISELELKQIRAQQLSDEIEIKNNELTNIAQEIGRKNHFSRDVLTRVKEITKSGCDEKKLKELIFYVHSSLEVNKSYEELQKSVDENNAKFFDVLIDNFPKITSGERHIAGLIRLGLTSKEIAGVRNITVPSVEVARHRIRKKMELDKQISLTEFLKEI